MICPIESRIKPLEDKLSANEATAVYLLSGQNYPSIEESQKYLNIFRTAPYLDSKEKFDYQMYYWNLTENGIVRFTDKNRLEQIREFLISQGLQVSNIALANGRRKISNKETYMIVVDKPAYKEIDTAEGFNDEQNFYNYNEKVIPVEKPAFNKIDYTFKVSEKITSNLNKIVSLFKQIGNNDTFWNKIQKDFQIPKDQLELLKNAKGNNIEEKLSSFLADYSYTVEVETRKQYISPSDKELIASNGQAKSKEVNSSYYSNLTVPGGTNYTENEIATPDITPSIKGHAQFATDKGIGWFRSDDKLDNAKTAFQLGANEYIEDDYGRRINPKNYTIAETGTPTKTRRILEVQSDLFQKGRDKSDLTKDSSYFEEGVGEMQSLKENEFDKKGNDFLQLLNKDNNWVTFFIKSIIQDSYRKGYEKVLFPLGDTASKIEGHTTLEEFKKQKEDRINKLEKIIKEIESKGYIEKYDYDSKVSDEELAAFNSAPDGVEPYKVVKDYSKKALDNALSPFISERNQLKQELERIETEGFGALRPIYNFYETTVANILKKQGYSPNIITDEYGNKWNEITLEKNRDSKSIAFNKSTGNKQAVKTVTTLLNNLSKRFNVAYEIINTEKAKSLIRGYNNEKAFFYNKKVYLLEDGLSLVNALHEFSHPFVRAIANQNEALFNSILTEILNTKEGKDIESLVKELYPEHIENGNLNKDGLEEVAVRALTKLAEEKYESKEYESIVTKLLNAIRNLLRRIFVTNGVDNISANTTLEELADILLEGKLDLSDTEGTLAFNKENPEQKVIKAIKEWLVKREEVIKTRAKEDGRNSRFHELNKIRKALETLPILETVEQTVNDVHDTFFSESNVDLVTGEIKSISSVFSKLKKQVENAKTQEEAENLLGKIVEFEEYVSGLDLIDYLQAFIRENDITNGDLVQKIKDIRYEINTIETDIAEVRPMLLAVANGKYINEELQKNIKEHKPKLDKLNKQIEEAEKESNTKLAENLRTRKDQLLEKTGLGLIDNLEQVYIKGYDNVSWFLRKTTAIINSSDTIGALFAKRYKEGYNLMQQSLRELGLKLRKEYLEFAEGKNKDDFKQLYDNIIEDVNTLRYNSSSGQYEYFKEKHFVTDFNLNAYYASKKSAWDLAALEIKKAQESKLNGDIEDYNKRVTNATRIKAKWYKDNMVPEDRETILQILKDKRKLYSNTTFGLKEYYMFVAHQFYNQELAKKYENRNEDPEQLAAYGKEVAELFYQSGNVEPKGIFLVPDKSKFKNKKYEQLESLDKDFKLYKTLYTQYLKDQSLLPEAERPGSRIPSVEKDILDIVVQDKDLKKAGKEKWNREFSSHFSDEEKGYNEGKKRIPIYYNKPLDADLVSLNIVDSILRFSEMANKFHYNASVESLAKATLQQSKDRDIIKTTPKGKKVINKIFKRRFKEDKEETVDAESEATKMLEAFIDRMIYNDRRNKLYIGSWRIDKTVDTIMSANALTVLGADVLKAASNRLTAGLNIRIESLGNKYFNLKDLTKGQLKVYQLMYATPNTEENLLIDTTRGIKTSKFGQMLDIFQALQTESGELETFTGSKVRRHANTSLLMAGLEMGEFISQAEMFASIAENTKVKTKDGKEITLYEAYEKDAQGIVRLRKDVEFTKEDEQEVRNKINAINKQLHGIYNSLDEVEAKKDLVGRMLLQFKNFLIPNWRRRYQSMQVDHEMGDVVEGYYATLWRKVITEKNYKVWQLKNDPTLTESEKDNLKKAVAELSVYFILLTLGKIMAQMADDDDELKKSDAYNFAFYEVLRVRSEIGTFIPIANIQEGQKILKNPSATNTIIERAFKTAAQLFNPLEEYKRKTGPWEKGDSKLLANVLKLFLGYTGANSNPKIAVDNFRSLIN